ncbi:unnamed protein product [Heligmosomoides polygyrus]|uniref:HTH CENPB-type domain-containing protein n=1 Tax=Heligmosomoides polygyrus TaxID=6339 RepID=A0A183GQG8_HELPZ|nr:unnamed protein product [Heligmosomoides polygyrus]
MREKEAAVISRVRLPTVTTVEETWEKATDAIRHAARSELGATKRFDDRLMKIVVTAKERIYHFFSAYAPQIGCSNQAKDEFWSLLDEKTADVPSKDVTIVVVTLMGTLKQVERCGAAKIKWWRMREKEAAVISRVRLPTVTTVEETWEKATDAIRHAARSELGATKPGRRKVDKQAWLWIDDVKAKVREKKTLYHVFLGEETADNSTRSSSRAMASGICTDSQRIDRGHREKITVEEIEEALKKMRPGKATGPDDVAAELWKSKFWYPAEWLAKFFNQPKYDDSDLEEEGQSCRLLQLPSNSFAFAQHEDL